MSLERATRRAQVIRNKIRIIESHLCKPMPGSKRPVKPRQRVEANYAVWGGGRVDGLRFGSAMRFMLETRMVKARHPPIAGSTDKTAVFQKLYWSPCSPR
jgi:hypothetical protein